MGKAGEEMKYIALLLCMLFLSGCTARWFPLSSDKEPTEYEKDEAVHEIEKEDEPKTMPILRLDF